VFPREFIPGDGEVIEGVASGRIAITGESAPVIRESAATVRRNWRNARALRQIKVRITRIRLNVSDA